MKIQVKNLGALRQAEFSLGDLTIICGGNNTGKTYATYALFGFLYFWREAFSVSVKAEDIEQLLAEGVGYIGLPEYVEQAGHILADGCKEYAKQLPTVFASSADRFKETEFQVILDTKDIHRLTGRFDQKMRSVDAELFSITKSEGSTELVVTLLVEKDKIRIPKDIIMRFIADAIKEIVFGHLFPSPFIASTERTGAAIFRKELDFIRNRLLEKMSQTDKDVNLRDILSKVYQDYALPVKENVDFMRGIGSIAKESNFIVEKHPEVLADFADIIGGEYIVINNEIYYMPKGKQIKLSMGESSSAVRSLLDVGFYLKHVAQHGDLLMVDEPELNLHPENQRRVARLFARLVNLGIKIFITTHSDYIIKELNTLIMLNHDKPYLNRIAEREGYKAEELISSDKIKVYIAEEALVKLDGGKRQTRCQTLVSADINPEFGIEARSFDTTIETMNRIQEEIVWGGSDV